MVVFLLILVWWLGDDADQYGRRERLLATVRASPEMQAAGVVVHVFGLRWVKLDHDIIGFPKQVFDGAHDVPRWAPIRKLSE